MKEVICLLAWLVSLQLKPGMAIVNPLEKLPPDLESHFNICRGSGDLSQQSGKLVFWTSMQQYISKFVISRPSLSQQEAAFFRSNFEAFMRPIFNASHRIKRQTATARVRKEIRAMTDQERATYFRAVNRMKNDRRMTPNVYDVLAGFHRGDNIARAHFGPAFPAWHRLYLWLYEGFLRLYEPTTTVPYWGSVMDNEMADPTQSVIWSSRFYGNGVGEPNIGPFADWIQINPATVFTRNIGNGALYSYEGIQNILRRTRNRQILIPTAEADSNFELQHGGAHTFISGSMNRLDEATRDPIFFSHHAFVDQIWEQFRTNQLQAGINPETDYPYDASDSRFRPQHSPTSMMGFFPNREQQTDYQNREGYSNQFSNLVQYEDVPRCPACANSAYLFCNFNLNPARCVSRTAAELSGTFRATRSVRSITSVHSIYVSLPLSQAYSARKPQPLLDVCHQRSFINDFDTNIIRSEDARTLQSLPNKWVYIPVKVVSKRPPLYHQFSQYSLYNKNSGVHLPGLKAEFARPAVQKAYDRCQKYIWSTGKITIVSYGLNYDGFAEEYVVVDNRLGVAEGYGYVPVKMPVSSYSDVIIAAFDECGRVCKPYCKQDMGISSTHGFTGGVRISTHTPLQYYTSYAQAITGVWDIPSQNSCPTIDSNQIPVSFFCEYTDTWPWGGVAQTRRLPVTRMAQKESKRTQ